MPNYGDPAYWDQRYRDQQGKTFDWLEDFDALKPYIQGLSISSDAKVIVLGCGNAEFSEDLYDDPDLGIKDVVNIDISPVVIEQMNARSQEKQRPGMIFEVGDVMSMKYPDNSFDLAVDKSTIDALLCGENSFLNVAKMTREVQRVLKSGGVYMVISYGTPDTRLEHFTRAHLDFEVDHFKVEDASDSESTHYVYLCTKGVNSESTIENWPEVEAQLSEES